MKVTNGYKLQKERKKKSAYLIEHRKKNGNKPVNPCFLQRLVNLIAITKFPASFG